MDNNSQIPRGGSQRRSNCGDLTPRTSINWAPLSPLAQRTPAQSPWTLDSNGQIQIFSYLNCSERLPVMKNNKTTELAANTNLAGWKIISRTISLWEFRERWVQTVQYWKFETEWPGYLSGAFSTRTLFIFAKTIHFCYIIITYCRHVWWRCDHMISSDQTSGRHQPDTGDTRHVTSGVTMSGYTRQTECI